jgi:hypothetical protein
MDEERTVEQQIWERLDPQTRIYLIREVERKATAPPPPPGPSFHQRARKVLAFDVKLQRPKDQPFVILPPWLGRPARKGD